MKHLLKKITGWISNHKKISAVTLFLILWLTFLPVMLKHAAVYTLKKNGADTVSIDDIDLNLFTGNLEIKNLFLKGKNSEGLTLPTLKTNMAMSDLLLGRISAESITINELEITIENTKNAFIIGISVPKGSPEQIVIEKDTLKKQSEEKLKQKGLAFGIQNFEITNSIIKYKDGKHTTRLDINKISVHDLFSWEKHKETTIKINSRLNNSPLLAKIIVKPFADARSIKTDIQLEHLPLKGFAAYTTKHIEGLDGFLDMDLQVSIHLDQSMAMDLKQSGSVSVSKIKGSPLNIPIFIKINQTEISYKGKTHIKLANNGNVSFLELSGTLSNGLLNMELGDRKAIIQHKGLEWTGNISNSTGQAEKTEINGRIEIADLMVDEDTDKIHILTLDRLKMEDIFIKGAEVIRLGVFTTTGLSVAKPAAEIVGVKSITPFTNGGIIIRDIQFNNMNTLNIHSMDISDTTFFLQKTSASELPLLNAINRAITNFQDIMKKQENGTIDLMESLQDSKPASSPTTTAEVETEEPLLSTIAIAMGSITFSGKNSVEVADKSVKPSFTKHIDIETLSITEINNNNINNEARLEVLLKSDRHASIGASGTMMPFHPRINLDLKGTIQTLPLVDLSPYIAAKTGYNIKTGTLSADIVCKIESDELYIKNKLFVENIRLVPKESNQIHNAVKPLDQMLSLLRDRDGNITLNIPVTGNIHNPSFNLQDIYKRAITTAAKSASVNIVKDLLQSSGNFINIVQLTDESGDSTGKMILEPLEFMPGATELDAQGRIYLDKLAKLLIQKPELRLSLCGYSTPAEIEDLDFSDDPDPFIVMARKRQEHVIIHLESRGVSYKQLFNCNANIDKDKEAKPRVEISI